MKIHAVYERSIYSIWLGMQRSGALMLLLLLTPLFAVLYLAVRLGSKGPFLYSQERPGLLGKRFRIWKIRTMAEGSDKNAANGLAVARNSPQITRLGKLLRDLKLDELPQLWNVFRGDMELVGPRPIAQNLFDKLMTELPLFRLRTTVRPGLTNLSQICILDNLAVEQVLEDWSLRLEGEVHYLRHKSVVYDVVMIGMTACFVLRKIAFKFASGVRKVGRKLLAPLGQRGWTTQQTGAHG